MAKREIKECTHPKEDYTVYLVPPIDTGVRNFNGIVKYYQYHAPQIDCVHSIHRITDLSTQEAVFKELMKIANMQNRHSFVQRFQPNSLALFQLEGNVICLKCPRMVCKKGKEETELSALLRHLRNVFAHGRTYIKKTKNQTYVILEDYDTSNSKKPKLSAKIVITKAILEKWKAFLENQVEV